MSRLHPEPRSLNFWAVSALTIRKGRVPCVRRSRGSSYAENRPEMRDSYPPRRNFGVSVRIPSHSCAGSRNLRSHFITTGTNIAKHPLPALQRLDANGIARCWTRINGAIYRPGFIAMYALDNLEKYLRSGKHLHLNIFLNQVNWLEQCVVIRMDGAVVWPQNFDMWEGTTLLKAPWLSANVQGLVISALVRAWRITRQIGRAHV